MLRTLTGRLTAWIVLVVAVVAAGAVIALAGSVRTSNDPTATLPEGAESTRVAELLRQLPSGEDNPALIVYSRGGQPLTAADEAKITADAGAVGSASPASTIRSASLPSSRVRERERPGPRPRVRI